MARLRSHSAQGLTLLELMVALGLFGLVALAFAQSAVTAFQARQKSVNWMHATQLAAECMERIRAGDRSHDAGPIGIFERSWSKAPVEGRDGLRRVDVTVLWEDPDLQCFTLSALLWKSP